MWSSNNCTTTCSEAKRGAVLLRRHHAPLKSRRHHHHHPMDEASTWHPSLLQPLQMASSHTTNMTRCTRQLCETLTGHYTTTAASDCSD